MDFPSLRYSMVFERFLKWSPDWMGFQPRARHSGAGCFPPGIKRHLNLTAEVPIVDEIGIVAGFGKPRDGAAAIQIDAETDGAVVEVGYYGNGLGCRSVGGERCVDRTGQ